jgi:hypothetical protein
MNATHTALVIRVGLFLRDTYYYDDCQPTDIANRAIRWEMRNFIMSHPEMSQNQWIRTFAVGLTHILPDTPTPIDQLMNDFRAALQNNAMNRGLLGDTFVQTIRVLTA